MIFLETDASGLPHGSVAVHVSVTVPPHIPGVPLNVDKSEVPLIKQLPPNPLVNAIELGAGNASQVTVISAGAVIAGNVAGSTVIVLDTLASDLPHGSIAVHVSVTVPPHPLGVAVKVDVLDVPLIKHPPVNPFVYAIVVVAGMDPHATVMSAGAVIVGNAAGSTVIVLDTGASGLPHGSVAVHVSVTVPPHAPGVAVKVEVFDVPLIKHPPANPLV